MISHEHKCIFVAQRKCAGTSIIHTFGYRYTSPDTLPPEWHYMNQGVLTPEYHERPRDYLVFTVVRNPWDRFISGWLFCPSTRDVPLRDLLRHLPRDVYAHQHLSRLQGAILYDQSGNLIAEEVIRFEDLQAGFDRVYDKIGKPRTVLHHLNPSPVPRKHYREYFTDPIDRDLFARQFARDVDDFEYEF